MPSEDASLDKLNVDLKRIGRLPRLLTAALAAIAVPIGWASSVSSGSFLVAGFVVGIPLLFLVLAFRVTARATSDAVIVRSYLKTYVVPFDDVLAFNNAAYSGLWNRSADTDTWLNFGLRMVEVVRAERVDIPLRATICRRRTCERVVEHLNTRLRIGGPE